MAREIDGDKTLQDHARKVATCCYIACDATAAEEISKTLCALADRLDLLEGALKKAKQGILVGLIPGRRHILLRQINWALDDSPLGK